jgi:hypothetical protein
MIPCGHPRAARMVVVYAEGPRAEDRRLRTECWACAVEREIAAKSKRAAVKL